MSHILVRKLWSYARGYVIIKVKGSGVAEFLDKMSRQGVYLWEIERLSPDLSIAKVSVHDAEKLNELAATLPIKIELRHQVGLPFWGKRLWERAFFVIGGLLSLICICLLSSQVWFVRIQGVESLDQALLKEILRAQGVKVGIAKGLVVPRDLERTLMLTVPELAWVTVDLHGVLLTVEVAEKAQVDPDEKAPGDIVAGKPALITQVVPFAGEPTVMEGETVIQGQVLIGGGLPQYGPPGPEGSQGPESPGMYLRAGGLVKGRVWYTGFGEAAVVQVDRHRSGQLCKRYHLILGPWQCTWGVTQPPYRLYAEARTTRTAHWQRFDLRLPLQLEITAYHELVEERIEHDLETAKARALHNARQDIEARLAPRAEILAEEIEMVTEERDGEILIRVRQVVEAHEEIGVFRAVDVSTAADDEHGATGNAILDDESGVYPHVKRQ